MLRIAYYTKKRDACWWVRILNPMSILIDKGHQCEDELLEQQLWCYSCDYREVQERQWDEPVTEFKCVGCDKVIFPETSLTEWRENIQKLIDTSDICVFQRPTHASHIALMQKCKDAGKKIIQTADDHYLDVPKWNNGFKYYTDRRPTIIKSFQICDAVDVTTRYLKDLYSKYCKHVELLPNSQDIELIDATAPMLEVPAFDGTGARLTTERFNEMRAGKKLIMWGGSPTHEKDLEVILPALWRIRSNPDICFAFVGYVHRQILQMIPKEKLFLFSIISNSQYFMLYKALKAELGLAPVVDLPFNRAKSSNKIVEYQILGTLPIASDTVTYAGFSPKGIYASNDEYSWYLALRKAIGMTELERLERVAENRKYVEENFDIKKNVILWEQFYEKVLNQ